jgi:hypothetical protein
MSGELVEQSGIGALVCLRPWTDHPIRIDLDKVLFIARIHRNRSLTDRAIAEHRAAIGPSTRLHAVLHRANEPEAAGAS